MNAKVKLKKKSDIDYVFDIDLRVLQLAAGAEIYLQVAHRFPPTIMLTTVV